ncbi:MAG: hypothetical protein CTY15_11365 [Methylocystis sp.]|nr:MAG: hypothetical protein CTY15_11365 [Methylocystis sp.]
MDFMVRQAPIPLSLAIALAVLAFAGGADGRPLRHGAPPFRCALRETTAFLPELRTYSGYRWVECVVGVAQAQIDSVAINNGTCESFDWAAGRSFAFGQVFYIPYACMSPVKMVVTANGAAVEIPLR